MKERKAKDATTQSKREKMTKYHKLSENDFGEEFRDAFIFQTDENVCGLGPSAQPQESEKKKLIDAILAHSQNDIIITYVS